MSELWRVWPKGDAVIGVAVTTVWDSPGAPREIDAPMVADVVLPHRWMSNLTTADRLGLMGRATTQALLGEPVLIVAESEGWTEVRLPWQPTSTDARGYPGFVRTAHLTSAPSAWADGGLIEAAITTTRLSHRPATTAHEAQIVSIGSALFPDSPLGRNEEPAPLRPFTVHLEQFLGIGYLWSGLSGWGVDCSGLIHVCARAAGLIIPRDSVDQYSAVLRGELDLPLLFFAHPEGHERAGKVRHVAVDLGDETMLHAPRAGHVVEVISASTPPYDTDRIRTH